MLQRALAACLALLVSIMSLGGVEGFEPLPSQALVEISKQLESKRGLGSIEDHHLDDLPAQADVQAADGPPAMPELRALPRPPASWNRVPAARAPGSPYLDGPLRPPRA